MSDYFSSFLEHCEQNVRICPPTMLFGKLNFKNLLQIWDRTQ